MYNEFDAGDDFSFEQEMYENDLELRGNNEAWEDAQAEQEDLYCDGRADEMLDEDEEDFEDLSDEMDYLDGPEFDY